ncbi:MAG TPA: TlpA disulfide reductase family protein, partial [Acidobacteriota bacterium]|nr:TlpA disulfide reductase family protein [Acidobacteriota bacterium]
VVQQVADHLGQQGRIAGQMTETYTRLQPAPAITEQTFSFTPPAGAQQVAAVQALQNSKYKPGTLPIPINATDLAGNPVSLDQFKGKVVLLDFWATWCAPCRAELPNVIAAYTKYQKQGFEVLGISLDNANAQAALTQFIKENKMPWRQIYEGKGWEGTISSQYQIRSIPFTLLLGRDGRIAAVNVRGATLEPAIQQALTQKG